MCCVCRRNHRLIEQMLPVWYDLRYDQQQHGSGYTNTQQSQLTSLSATESALLSYFFTTVPDLFKAFMKFAKLHFFVCCWHIGTARNSKVLFVIRREPRFSCPVTDIESKQTQESQSEVIKKIMFQREKRKYETGGEGGGKSCFSQLSEEVLGQTSVIHLPGTSVWSCLCSLAASSSLHPSSSIVTSLWQSQISFTARGRLPLS